LTIDISCHIKELVEIISYINFTALKNAVIFKKIRQAPPHGDFCFYHLDRSVYLFGRSSVP
jgi:hypothetical protein